MVLTYEQRLKTSTAWCHSSPSEEEMAAAGFIFIGKSYMYDGQDDAVKCLECDIQLEPCDKEYIPLEWHAKHKPDCPFIIAHQAAALSAKAVASAKVEELNNFWKEKVGIVERSRKDAEAMLAAEKDAHAKTREDSLSWISKAESAKAATANVKLERDAWIAAQATKIHELDAELNTWKSMTTPLRTAPAGKDDSLETPHVSGISEMEAEVEGLAATLPPVQAATVDEEATHTVELDQLRSQTDALTQLIAPLQAAANGKNDSEVGHTTELEQLKTDMKALTSSISPLQATIEALTGAIIHLQPEKSRVDHQTSSKGNGNIQLIHHTADAGRVVNGLTSWAETRSEPSNRFASKDVARDVAAYARGENDTDSDRDDDVRDDEAEEDFVTLDRWGNSSEGVSVESGAWGPNLDDEDAIVKENGDGNVSVGTKGGFSGSLSNLREVDGGSAADESAKTEKPKSEETSTASDDPVMPIWY